MKGKINDRSRVIPIGISATFSVRAELEIQSTLARYAIHSPYILYVGSSEARKNLPRLLEAYARLRTWSQRWQLVVAGGGHFGANRTTTVLIRLNLAQHVRFVGTVAEDNLPLLYSGADLFVFPSLLEGFGLPVVEAMACGVPVVTSMSSSLPEIAGDAALLVDPYDPEGIAKAMRQVLEDPHVAAILRTRGLTQARKFGWERTARETVLVYEQVLRGKWVVNNPGQPDEMRKYAH